MFNTKYIDQPVGGIKPTDQGWMWPADDNYFMWFQETAPQYLEGYRTFGKQFRVAVQAGGHLGVYPRLMSTLYETVYTFEPDTESFHCLVNNCQTMNIKKYNAALGNQREMLYQTIKAGHNVGVNQFAAADQNTSITKYLDVDEREEKALVNVPQIRIDDMGLTCCDLIHLDIEMSEDKAFEGALETIDKFRPLLVMETVPPRWLHQLSLLGYSQARALHCGDAFYAC